MRTYRLFALLILLSLLSINTSSQSAAAGRRQKARIDIEDLCQSWVHSSEEQKPNASTQIYRPEGFKRFPPSMGRMRYIFHKNGDCEWYYFSPDDAHRFKPGKWKIDPNDKSVLQIVKDNKTESYSIVELTKDLLRIEVIKSAR